MDLSSAELSGCQKAKSAGRDKGRGNWRLAWENNQGQSSKAAHPLIIEKPSIEVRW